MAPHPFFLSVWWFAAGLACAAPEIFVRGTDGRGISIELIGVENDNVIFRRSGDPQEFTLPLSQFDESSQERIRETGATLAPRRPKIEIEVIISRKREKQGSYMVQQTVSSEVKFRNPDLTLAYPESKGRIVYLGEDRSTPGNFAVMAVRDFTFSLTPNGNSRQRLDEFESRYDSDNKGYNNVGGLQYSAYLLVIYGDEGEIILTHTTDATMRRLCNTPEGAKKLADCKPGTPLNKNFEPRKY